MTEFRSRKKADGSTVRYPLATGGMSKASRIHTSGCM